MTQTGQDSGARTMAYLHRMMPIFVVTGVCLSAIVLYGRYEPGMPALRDALPGNPGDYSLSQIYVWTRPLLNNFGRVLLHFERGRYTVFQLVVYGVILLAIMIVLIEAYRANRRSLDVLFMAPLAVLPLFVIGIDYSRWLGLMWIVSLAVLMIKIIDGDFDRLFVFKLWNSPFLVLLCALPLGPIGVQNYFPVFRYYLGLY